MRTAVSKIFFALRIPCVVSISAGLALSTPVAAAANLMVTAKAGVAQGEDDDEDDAEEVPTPDWSGTVEVARCQAKPLQLPKQTETAMNSVYIVRAGKAQGSAVAASRDGFMLTAAHVVQDLREAQLESNSGIS